MQCARRGSHKPAKNPVALTWIISFEQICHRNTLPAEFMLFIACVELKNVPQSLLPPGPSPKEEMKAIRMLITYLFTTGLYVDVALNIHRLVHLTMRNCLRKEALLTHRIRKAIFKSSDASLVRCSPCKESGSLTSIGLSDA